MQTESNHNNRNSDQEPNRKVITVSLDRQQTGLIYELLSKTNLLSGTKITNVLMAINTNTYEEINIDSPKLQERSPTSVCHDTNTSEESNIDCPNFTGNGYLSP